MTKKHSISSQPLLLDYLQLFDKQGLCALVETLFNQMMLAEREIHIGAQLHQHAKHERTAYANGTKPSKRNTGLGTLGFEVPQTRPVPGREDEYEPYYPSVLERGMRSERSLMATIAEMYIQGVSTRDVNKIAKKMGLDNISSTMVSSCTKQLDESLKAWRERPIGEIVVLIIDARYEKIRLDGAVRDCAVFSAIGITPDGRRTVLGTSVGLSEAQIHWQEFLESLVARGMHGVKMIVSDAHSGLSNARKAVLCNVPWQRCQFHLAQNAQHKCHNNKQKNLVGQQLRDIFDAESLEDARVGLRDFVAYWEKKNPTLATWAEEAIAEGLTIFTLDIPEASRKKLRTSNTVERCIQQELKRRTRKIRVFPNEASLLRLVSALLVEQDEEWASGNRVYLTAAEAILSLPGTIAVAATG